MEEDFYWGITRSSRIMSFQGSIEEPVCLLMNCLTWLCRVTLDSATKTLAKDEDHSGRED